MGIFLFFIWKKKKHEKAEGSAVNPENAVLMLEIRSSPS